MRNELWSELTTRFSFPSAHFSLPALIFRRSGYFIRIEDDFFLAG